MPHKVGLSCNPSIAKIALVNLAIGVVNVGALHTGQQGELLSQ